MVAIVTWPGTARPGPPVPERYPVIPIGRHRGRKPPSASCGTWFFSTPIPHDVGGIAVHIGARIASLAEPGEIPVSRTAKALVAGSGIDFEDRAEHDPKGVPGRWQLYALAG